MSNYLSGMKKHRSWTAEQKLAIFSGGSLAFRLLSKLRIIACSLCLYVYNVI